MSRTNKTKYLNYSSSRLKHFFSCPMAMHLSRSHKPVFVTSTKSVMDAGLLFEGYVLGFKDRTEEELIGRKKAPTIDKIKGHAETVADVFGLGTTGKSYHFITYDNDELQATVRGELDYLGTVNSEALEKAVGSPVGDIPKAIWDVKYTGNIPRVWDWKLNKEDYLQAVMYTYLHYKTTGEHLPFYYLIIESQYERPIVRCIRIDITEQDWNWLESVIAETNGGFNTVATPSFETCLGSNKNGRCWFIEHCKYGRSLCGGFQVKTFSDLPSNI